MGTDSDKAFVKKRLRMLKAAAIKYGASLDSDRFDIEDLPFLDEIREKLEVSQSFEVLKQFAKLGVEIGIAEAKDDIETSRSIRADMAVLSISIHGHEKLGRRFYESRRDYGYLLS